MVVACNANRRKNENENNEDEGKLNWCCCFFICVQATDKQRRQQSSFFFSSGELAGRKLQWPLQEKGANRKTPPLPPPARVPMINDNALLLLLNCLLLLAGVAPLSDRLRSKLASERASVRLATAANANANAKLRCRPVLPLRRRRRRRFWCHQVLKHQSRSYINISSSSSSWTKNS